MLESIGNYAFYKTQLNKFDMDINAPLVTIGEYAFANVNKYFLKLLDLEMER